MRFLALPSLLLALPAVAAEPAASMSSTGMGTQMTKLLLGLLLVIGLIFLLAWLLRRMQQLNPRSNQAIKLISSHALGPRERLVLIQVGSEQVLLGLSAAFGGPWVERRGPRVAATAMRFRCMCSRSRK